MGDKQTHRQDGDRKSLLEENRLKIVRYRRFGEIYYFHEDWCWYPLTTGVTSQKPPSKVQILNIHPRENAKSCNGGQDSHTLLEYSSLETEGLSLQLVNTPIGDYLNGHVTCTALPMCNKLQNDFNSKTLLQGQQLMYSSFVKSLLSTACARTSDYIKNELKGWDFGRTGLRA